ncbi:FAD-binding protein [Pseudomonas viridiflava]|uniref:FAD-binding protein n=1 Tax=Pseudomonas viridiflava TaxID=33069 RepID=UPI001F1493EE|nr:FAD-binding protein [Pseudomonas viridiflava]
MVIAGGGPAGCAAALTLCRHTDLSVMLVEQTGTERTRSENPGHLRSCHCWTISV